MRTSCTGRGLAVLIFKIGLIVQYHQHKKVTYATSEGSTNVYGRGEPELRANEAK